jgi:uncharacterized protein involved in outer membrane biogenesis
LKKLLISVSAAALLAVAAPMALPRLVNWNDYRDELSRRVGEAAGRAVVFDGDLGLQLLPAPALTAADVRVKAPAGFSRADMATLKRLEVRIALWPLLTGRIQVESIVAVAPHMTVETDAAGRVNWRAAAGETPAGGAALGERIGPLAQSLSFDQIVLENGRLEIVDHRSGLSETLDNIDLRVVAGSLTGPFQAGGGLSLRGAPLRLEATTGRFAGGAAAPVRLAVTLPGGDPERLSGARFAGIVSPEGPGPRLQGELRLEGPNLRAAVQPMHTAALSEKLARPFALRATVEADDARVRLDNLEAMLGEARGGGSAALNLGENVDLTVNLLFSRLELDPWLPPLIAAADGKTPPKRAATTAKPSPAGAADNDGAFVWPEKLRLKIEAAVDAAAYAGGTLRQGRLTATADKNGVTVDRLAALIPGGGFAATGSAAFPPGGAPNADFRVEVNADNLRALLDWLRIDAAAVPADRLRKFAFAGRLTGNSERFDAADGEIELDGAKLTGALSADLRARPAFGLRLTADRLDLDAYFPAAATGKPAAPSAAPSAAAAAPSAAAPGDTPEAAVARLLSRGDAALQVRVQELTFGGRVWRDAALDAAAAGGGLDLRNAEIQDAEGDKWRLTAQVADFAPLTGAQAVLTGDVADLPAALRRSGLAAEGGAAENWATAAPAGPAHLRLRLAGDRDKLGVETLLSATGGRFELGGHVVKPLSLLGISPGNGGRVDLAARLARDDADLLFAPWGFAAPAAPGPFDVYAKFNGDAHRLTISDIKGMVGGAAITGSAKFDRKAVRPWVEADLQTGVLDLDRLREKQNAPAPTAAAAQTAVAQAVADIAPDPTAVLRRYDGRFALTAAGLRAAGLDFGNVAAKAHLTDGRLAVDRFDAVQSGGRVGGQAVLSAATGDRPARLHFSATAEGLKPAGPISLGPFTVAGTVADAETDLTVSDPFAPTPLARLNGTARLVARGGALKGVDMAGLRDRLQRADRPQILLDAAMRGLQGGETRITALDAGFTIENGVAETVDSRLESPAGGVGAVGRVNLAARTLDMLLTVEPDTDPPFPPLVVRLTGPLDAPTRSLDLNALQRRLIERLGGAGAPD